MNAILNYIPIKLVLALYSLLCVVPFANCQTDKTDDTCCVSNLRNTGIQKASIAHLSKEYKRLKSLKNSCCKHWNSDLHQIMSELAVLLGKEGTDIKLVVKYVGKPDSNEKKLPYQVVDLKEGEKLMIYFWRGYHDFVYFVYNTDKIRYANWYMALE